jgi:ADP-ribose pyrophosphatase YjhB (NUDIX family)
MKKYQKSNSKIQVHARAFLFQGNKVILCRAKENDERNWHFLPGGHVETGESTQQGLLRELKEEIGSADYKIISFIGMCENIFLFKKGVYQQEINSIFEVQAPLNFKIKSQEDHLEFKSVNINELNNYNILPAPIKDALIGWLKNRKTFFIMTDNLKY